MNDSAYKKLVFFFYANEKFEESKANIIHKKCLTKYKDVFDEALILISLKDTNDDALIKRAVCWLADIGFHNVSFKVIPNTQYRECDAFYEEVVKKISSFEGLVFWGHNKGSSFNNENVYKWIAAMYFLSFCKIDDVDWALITKDCIFYGPLLLYNEAIQNKSHMYYQGGFYWLNAPLLVKKINYHNVDIPKLDSLGYSEEFPGNLFSCELSSEYCASLGFRFCNGYCDLYYNPENIYKFYVGDDRYEDFEKFVKYATE